jgi:5S rRNA maturation endonuclease (ribonuclease M5)
MPAATREEILAANPLLDYCRNRGLELKRDGPNWTTRCPFHEEGTASFVVYPDNHYHCFGCKVHGSVIDLHMHYTGKTVAEAMADLSPKHSTSTSSKEVGRYPYHDPQGKAIFEVVRFYPKDFRQFRLDEAGNRIWKGGMGDTPRYPYQLPQVLKASEVWVVEGEKDAGALKWAGQVATCNPGGAGKWKAFHAEFLRSKDVIVVPDQDDPGREHGEMVINSLRGVAKTVRVVALPEGSKDVTDLGKALSLTNTLESKEKLVATLLERARPISFASFGANGEHPPFEEPIELEEFLLPVVPLDPNLIPTEIRPWILDIAERMQCSIDLVFHGAIAMFGSLAGTAVRVRPKEVDDWEETPNFYGGCVAPPGSMKTPAMSAIFRIVDRLEAEAFELYSQAMEGYEKQAEDYSTTKKGLTSKLKRLLAGTMKAKAGETLPTVEEIRAELEALEAPEKPSLRRFMVHDATVEKAHEIISENPRGLFLAIDELASLILLWEDPNHQKDRKFFLKGYSGKESHTIDRIIRGTVRVKNLCVSIYGGIQPEILADYMTKLSLAKDGMISRFLLLAYPDPSASWKLVDREPNRESREEAFLIAQRIAFMNFTEYGGKKEESEFDKFPYYRFDSEGQKAFLEWWSILEKRLRDKNESPNILQHLAKYRGLVPKLALTFHLIGIAASGMPRSLICLEHVQAAIGLAAYYESHMRRIYGLLTQPSLAGALILREKLIEKRLPDEFVARDVQRKNWPGLKGVQPVEAALQVLVDARWLAIKHVPAPPRGGWPTEVYVINPRVYQVSRRE